MVPFTHDRAQVVADDESGGREPHMNTVDFPMDTSCDPKHNQLDRSAVAGLLECVLQ